MRGHHLAGLYRFPHNVWDGDSLCESAVSASSANSSRSWPPRHSAAVGCAVKPLAESRHSKTPRRRTADSASLDSPRNVRPRSYGAFIVIGAECVGTGPSFSGLSMCAEIRRYCRQCLRNVGTGIRACGVPPCPSLSTPCPSACKY